LFFEKCELQEGNEERSEKIGKFEKIGKLSLEMKPDSRNIFVFGDQFPASQRQQKKLYSK